MADESKSEIERLTFTWRQKRDALVRQVRPYRRTFILLSILGIFSAIANGTVPLLIGRFLDGLLSGTLVALPAFGTVPFWSAMLGLWVFAQLVAISMDWLIARQSAWMTTELQAGYQARAFAHALTLPISFHKHHRAGEITETINRASWMLESMAGTLLTFAPALLSIVIGISIAFWLKPLLAIVLLAGLALYLLLLVRMLRPIAKVQEQASREWSEAFGDAYDAYTNITTVKHAAAERYECERIHRRYYEGAIPLWFKLETIWSSITYSQRAVILATQIIIFFISVYLIHAGQLSIGELVAFNSYAGMIFGPFVQLGRQWQQIQNGLINIARGELIFGTASEPYERPGAPDMRNMRGKVRFEDVHFTYELGQPEVLEGISFVAEPGQTVALVGETGAGKSTVADLVSGYYSPTNGRVSIDGHDIETLGFGEVRAHIAVVPQEVVLFNISIEDNIRYGRPDASDEEVREAAERAHAADFIEKFPKGYGQEVGERGVKLSVGQKQRVAIARAMLRDPRILILDEPTSALDAETERYITASLDELMQGRTTFIIAHRLSTVRKADLILVLKDGVITERGTHDELLAIPDGVYRHLYELHVGLHD